MAYTGGSAKILISQKLAGVGYTRDSGLPSVAYTDEPLVQPSSLPMLLKEQVLKNQIVSILYYLLARDSIVENFSDLTHSDRLPIVAYTGEST